jgi:hypothetical protein
MISKAHLHCKTLPFPVPPEVAALLDAAVSVTVATTTTELVELAVRDAVDGWHEVAYDVPGKGSVVEACVCRVRNGVNANYPEPYMRRRDPDCMVIGDKLPTDKPTYHERFGKDFAGVREETFEWLKGQDLAVFPFHAGMEGKGTDALVIAPANAGFFALGLSMLQGILTPDEIPESFAPRAVIYVAPPFRHTHFEGRQVVVHNRLESAHELFSYNLYPGPSAKKGIYGVLAQHRRGRAMGHHALLHRAGHHPLRQQDRHLARGRQRRRQERDARTRPPPGRRFAPASDGTPSPAKNACSPCRDPATCARSPTTWRSATRLWRRVAASSASSMPRMPGSSASTTSTTTASTRTWRKLTIHPPEPLLFLNVEGQPGATSLIWEHTEDAPGVPCPNPRVIIPRKIVPNVVKGAVDVDIRSMGVRTPPCTAELPSYGIIGMFHKLPPALAWLWRLVAPRGHANPSIVATEGMSSEGVGSYWPFATGRRVDQANLLLNQIIETPKVRYILTPNQHIGAWEVGFMPQWITREFLARRGGARFTEAQMKPSRCPLLGYTPGTIVMEGRTLGVWFFEVDQQPEVGTAAYDRGAEMLEEFFHKELSQFLVKDLLHTGRKIIECCLSGGTLSDYESLLGIPTLEPA